MNGLQTLFDSPQTDPTSCSPPAASKTCRTCKHRFRAQTDDHSTKWEQYCDLRKPERTNTVGRLKVKVTNQACPLYEGK